MGTSGFDGWSKSMVDAHNARVAMKQRAYTREELRTAPSVPSHHNGSVTIAKPLTPFISLDKQESTDIQKLNKLERSFYNLLIVAGHQQVWVQAIQLKLADDCRYLPDFVVLTKEGRLVAYETKGHRWAKNMIKLRMAARMFSVFKFVLVSKEKGTFVYEEMKP